MPRPGSKIKQIPLPASDAFIRKIGIGIRKVGFANRSEFIRDAVAEKLRRRGVRIPPELVQTAWILKQRAVRALAARKVRR